MWRFLVLLLTLGCTQKITPVEFEPIDVPAITFESDAPKVKPTITVYSPDDFNCSACERWKREKAPGFNNAGWEVVPEKAPRETGPFPWFHILDGDGKEYTIQEYLTSERLNAARNSRK